MDPHYNDPALVFIQDFLRHASVIREHMFEDSRERQWRDQPKESLEIWKRALA